MIASFFKSPRDSGSEGFRKNRVARRIKVWFFLIICALFLSLDLRTLSSESSLVLSMHCVNVNSSDSQYLNVRKST